MNRKESVRTFLKQHSPSREWQTNLDEHLPPAGEVTVDVPLIRIVDGGKEIFALKANEICTDGQLRKFNFIPPDGLWVKWGELAVRICGSVLPGFVEEMLEARELFEVPANWRIEFNWLRREEKPVLIGEFK